MTAKKGASVVRYECCADEPYMPVYEAESSGEAAAYSGQGVDGLLP